MISYYFWKKNKILHDQLEITTQTIAKKEISIEENILALKTKERQLKAIEKKIKNKESQISQQKARNQQLLTEKNVIEAKYQKKVKAAEVKKRNLAKYRQKKKDTRSVKEQAEDIIGKGAKWLPHSCQEPRSHNIGKPVGSKGGGRKRPEKIHQINDIFPHFCPNCHTSLKELKGYFVYNRILTDLFRERDEVDAYDILRIRNIQLNIHRKKCPQCNYWVYPDQGLFKNARFGVGLVAHVMNKRIRLGMPYDDIIGEMEEIFGIGFVLSTTAIIDWFYRFEDQIRDIYDQLEDLVRQEAFVHIDESGLPMQGKNWWLWVICTANLVLYRQSYTRGHKAIKDIIDGFQGTIVADFFRAYEKFNDNDQQKCLAHLLSDIIELIVGRQKENERIERKLKKHNESVKREQNPPKSTRGRKPKSHKLTEKQIITLKFRYDENQKTLNQATDLGAFFRAPFQDTCFSWKKSPEERIEIEDAQAILAGLIKSINSEGVSDNDLQKILKRCEKFSRSLFIYLEHEDMPPDNNLAERKLRKYARQRRRSQDFKSVDVTKHLMEYLGLYMTCEANGRDFHILLHDLLSGSSVDLREFLFGKPTN